MHKNIYYFSSQSKLFLILKVKFRVEEVGRGWSQENITEQLLAGGEYLNHRRDLKLTM